MARVPGSRTLQKALKCRDEDFVDFLRLCFLWRPEERIAPLDALQHPWIVKGFPQLTLGSCTHAKHSVSLDKCESLRASLDNPLGPMQQLYATQKLKPDPSVAGAMPPAAAKVNLSLLTMGKCKGLMNISSQPQICGLLLSKRGRDNHGQEELKVSDKLHHLKEKLKLASFKQSANLTTQEASPIASPERSQPNKSLLLHVLTRKTITLKPTHCPPCPPCTKPSDLV